MTRILILSLASLAALTLPACSASGVGGGGGSSNLITAEEIRAEEGISTAYEAVRRLRPRFLRGRTGARGTSGATNPRNRVSSAGDTSGVVVYLNGVKAGGVEVLRRVEAAAVTEIRFIGGRDATTRYGTGHGAGVIEVSTS